MARARTPFLIAGLTVAATASQILRVAAGNVALEGVIVDTASLVLLYAACLLLGLGLGLLARELERVRCLCHASRVLISVGLAVNLVILGIAYGIGGELFGELIAFAMQPGAIVVASAVLVLAGVRWHAALARALRSAHIEGVAILFVASSLVLDVVDAARLHAGLSPVPVATVAPRPVAVERPSIVHVLFDEMSGEMMASDPELSSAAFYRDAPSGVYYPSAYTNSVWTRWAVPQLMSGTLEPDFKGTPPLLQALQDAGYHLNLYLASGPLLCEQIPSAVCYSGEWVWDRVILGDRPFERLRRQLDKMRRIYAQRFVGGSEFVLGVSMPGRLKKLHESAASESLLLLDKFLEDFRANREPTYYFVHVLTPHRPFVLDGDCRVIADDVAIGPDPSSRHDPGYREQMRCANLTMKRIIGALRGMGRYDSTYLIFQSDHGPRRDMLGLLSSLGPGPHQLSDEQAEIVEDGARILLWMKPPEMSVRESSSRKVQLHEIPSMLLEDLHLEPLPKTSRAAQAGEIQVLTFDAIDGHVGSLQLLRDRGSTGWRSRPWTDREDR